MTVIQYLGNQSKYQETDIYVNVCIYIHTYMRAYHMRVSFLKNTTTKCDWLWTWGNIFTIAYLSVQIFKIIYYLTKEENSTTLEGVTKNPLHLYSKGLVLLFLRGKKVCLEDISKKVRSYSCPNVFFHILVKLFTMLLNSANSSDWVGGWADG